MKYLITDCCFEKTLIFTDQQPRGFENWTEEIIYKKCKAYLPTGDIIDIKSFVNNQGSFDSGSWTTFLLHRFNEN